MNERVFALFHEINTQGITNDKWGMYKGASSTKDLFGTKQDLAIPQDIVYIYVEDEEDLNQYIEVVRSGYLVLDLEDEKHGLLIICI